MEPESFLPYLSGTVWDHSNDGRWLHYQEFIEAAPSMEDRGEVSGKNILRYLFRKDVSSAEFKKDLDMNGFSYFKLLTLPKVTNAQRDKLVCSKQFQKHIGDVYLPSWSGFVVWFIFDHLGEGSSGVCVKVYDRDRRVFQVMKIQSLKDQNAVRDFRKEIKMLTRLSSPHIVQIEEGIHKFVGKKLFWIQHQLLVFVVSHSLILLSIFRSRQLRDLRVRCKLPRRLLYGVLFGWLIWRPYVVGCIQGLDSRDSRGQTQF